MTEKVRYKAGYRYQLVSDYSTQVAVYPPRDIVTDFVDLTNEGRITLKRGYAWDGPSGRTLNTKNLIRGSLVHDALYQLMRLGNLDESDFRHLADQELRRICLEDGMTWIRAWWVFSAARLRGSSAVSGEPKPILEGPPYRVIEVEQVDLRMNAETRLQVNTDLLRDETRRLPDLESLSAERRRLEELLRRSGSISRSSDEDDNGYEEIADDDCEEAADEYDGTAGDEYDETALVGGRPEGNGGDNGDEAEELVSAVLSAEGPSEVEVGKEAGVRVRLELRAGATPLAFSTEADIVPAERIAVMLTVVGPAIERIDPWIKWIAPPGANPVEEEFGIRAIAEGEAYIAVQFMQRNSPLGELSFSIRAVTDHPSEEPARVEAESAPADDADQRVLRLLIDETQISGRISYRVSSEALELHYEPFESLPLSARGTGATPLQYAQSIYDRLVKRVLLNVGDVTTFDREVRNIGTDLSRKLLPPDLVRLLWDTLEDVSSIEVTSNEPYLPWELLRLDHPDIGGRRGMHEKHLAEFGLARALHGRAAAKPLRVRDWRSVVGDYPEGSYSDVSGSYERVAAAIANRGLEFERIEPETPAVLDALEEDDFDVLHFACHGESELTGVDQASLILSDRLTPDGVQPVSIKPDELGGSIDFRNRRPLVFLNACESGHLKPCLTDWGGWPRTFLGAGAGAFVGTLWSVRNGPATAFAEAFYGSLLDGDTLADASGWARAAAGKGDASWLAYTVYGRPTARVTEEDRRPARGSHD